MGLAEVLTTLRKWRYWSHRYPAVWFEPMPKQGLFMGSGARERWLSGGNRSGKTDAAACDLALQAWGVKGLLFQGWPKDGKPRRFWAVALSADKQNDTVYPKLKWFLGPYAQWREADHMFVLANGSTIILKSQESDIDKFQSAALHGAWFDEVGKDAERYQETKARLVDYGGRVWTSFTPTRGCSWYAEPWERWEEETNGIEREAGGVIFVKLATDDNRYLPPKAIAELRRGFTSEDEARMRLYGDRVELRGLVFPSFDPQRHVIRCLRGGVCSKPLPEKWTAYRGHDYGKRYPAACIWVGIDPRDKELTVFREFYETGNTVPQICFRVKAESKEPVSLDVADPSLWNEEPMPDALGRFIRLKDMYHEHGVRIVPGNNRWLPGVEFLTQLLAPRGERPRLFVHECCRNLIREFRRYHWPEGGAEAPNARQAMGHDHALDALRYVCMALKAYMDGGDVLGGFNETEAEDGGFDGQRSASSGLVAPQVRRTVTSYGPRGEELAWRYERFWGAGGDEEEDGFNPS